jgi:hypothetical protein
MSPATAKVITLVTLLVMALAVIVIGSFGINYLFLNWDDLRPSLAVIALGGVIFVTIEGGVGKLLEMANQKTNGLKAWSLAVTLLILYSTNHITW